MDYNVDLSCKVDELVPGFKSLFKCTIPDSGKVELQHLSNYTGITGCIGLEGNLEKGYDPVLNLSGLVGTNILSLGGNVALDLPTRTISKLNAGLGLNTDFLVASLTMHDSFDFVKASCYHEVNPLTKTAIAAELNHSLSMGETSATVGAQHAFLPQTLVKARFDTFGRAGALIQQGFWERCFVTMAGEVEFNTSDNNLHPKVGVSVALKP
ncbi:Mitochondrial outer membrane protein porin 1 isoform B [Glycine soja]|nr:Mitochondrial outer membrane protein porin 1 [Glycine soja]RZC10722.1 Mitochondrial outer membrane protein porin 1 isoform B [Glycine soja]